MSLLNLIAVAGYCLTASACTCGLILAFVRRRSLTEKFCWFGCAITFFALAIIRSLELEDIARVALRQVVLDADMYTQRSTFQAPLALLLLFGLCLAVWMALKIWRSMQPGTSARLIFIATTATLGFVPLFALRILSYHAIDAVLYFGPIRPNWVIDGVLTGTVLICAYLYCSRRFRSRR